MDLGLAGEGVVVIGAAGGIGQAIAAGFAAEHCRLTLVDRDPAVHEVAQRLAATQGVAAQAWTADAAEESPMRAVAEQAMERLGTPRHIVVAVGVGSGKFGSPFWNLCPADWEAVLRINILACVQAAHVFTPPLLAQRAGSFCFLASVAGQIGSSTDPPYSAAKAAVLNFTQCAARDLAPYGIRANAICPGMVRTELNRSVWRAWAATVPPEEQTDYESWAEAKLRRVTPLGCWQTADEVAAVAVFLASRQAANITGQTLNVDGGQVMHF